MTQASCDRRAMLTTAAALPLLLAPGTSALAKKPSARRVYADTHVHLFNAHDLPIGMFMVEVLFGQGDLAPWMKAVVDYLLRGVQHFATSAREERGWIERRRTKSLSDDKLTPEAFGEDFARWASLEGLTPADKDAGMPSLFADEAERRAAYAALIEAVVADSRGTSIDTARKRLDKGLAAPATMREVRRAFAELAKRAEDPARPAPGEKMAGGYKARSGTALCEGPCADTGFSTSIGAILRYFGWGYLMLRSREYHLTKYLGLAAGQRELPVTLFNHLVDYDAWLGVPPRPGSSHIDQVETAHALAAKYRSGTRGRAGVEIATFAGFCPLKHALEVKAGRARSLDAMLALGSDKVAGFKLYPPMGFRALCNAELQDGAFDPRSRYRARHYAEWSRKLGSGGGVGNGIGTAIDAALVGFYRECETRGLPIMAHAGPGNQAGPAFGQRANPRYWLEVARRFKLRISLGHLVNSAEDFVCAVRRGGPAPDCVWSLHAGRKLLDPTAGFKATVYGDLAFMPELIDNPTLAVEFFKGLRAVFGEKDPALTRITYGSDYIMLGTMQDYDEHLRVMRTAMAKAEYAPEQVENILVNNARRFLTG